MPFGGLASRGFGVEKIRAVGLWFEVDDASGPSELEYRCGSCRKYLLAEY